MTGSVLIVGGGIAGRACARVLAQQGMGCTIVERRESVGRGMGVNLPGNAVRALAELGVPDQALAGGVPVRRREYRNSRGRLLFAVDDDRFWRDVGRPVCVRHGELLDALALPGAATLEHAQAVAARPTPAGVEVDLEGPSSPRHFDFVIGADGTNFEVHVWLPSAASLAPPIGATGWVVPSLDRTRCGPLSDHGGARADRIGAERLAAGRDHRRA